jgi:hypothetical protein
MLCYPRPLGGDFLFELGDGLSPIGVPLVVLQAGSSVAAALLDSGVGSAIAFARTARLLVERFCAELVNGLPVGQALNEARGRPHTDPGRRSRLDSGAHTIDMQDWFVPQLHQADADPVLTLRRALPSVEEVSAAVTPAYGQARYGGRTGRLHNFSPPPTYGFHGRARELLGLEPALRRRSAVLLWGGDGIGKIALAREVAAWWLRTGSFETAVFCNCADTAGAEQILQVISSLSPGWRWLLPTSNRSSWRWLTGCWA